jgi:ankyrin repeat protein
MSHKVEQKSPLHYAVERQHAGMVRCLVAGGADVNITDAVSLPLFKYSPFLTRACADGLQPATHRRENWTC